MFVFIGLPKIWKQACRQHKTTMPASIMTSLFDFDHFLLPDMILRLNK